MKQMCVDWRIPGQRPIHMPAQGNALGLKPHRFTSPEGAGQWQPRWMTNATHAHDGATRFVPPRWGLGLLLNR